MPEQTKSGIWLPDREEKANGFPFVDLLMGQHGGVHVVGPEEGDAVRIGHELLAFLADPASDHLQFTDPIFGDDLILTRHGAELVTAVVRSYSNKVSLKALTDRTFHPERAAVEPVSLGIGRFPADRNPLNRH